MTVGGYVSGQAMEQVSGTVSEQAGEHASEQAGEQASGIDSGIAGGTVSGHAREQVREQAREQAGGIVSSQAGEQVNEQVQKLINVIRDNVLTMFDIQVRLKISSRSFVQMKLLNPAIEGGYVLRAYPDKPSHPQQRYYLSEKGLKLVK